MYQKLIVANPEVEFFLLINPKGDRIVQRVEEMFNEGINVVSATDAIAREYDILREVSKKVVEHLYGY